MSLPVRSDLNIGYVTSNGVLHTEMLVRILVKGGVPRDRIYVDQIKHGRRILRPHRMQAIRASRPGDVFWVTNLDQLACSTIDLSETVEQIMTNGVSLSFGGHVYHPSDPTVQLFIESLSVIAKFEAASHKRSSSEAAIVPPADAKRMGRPPRLTALERADLLQMYDSHQFKIEMLCEKVGLGRSALYRNIQVARTECEASDPSPQVEV